MAIVRGKTTQFQVSVPTTTAKEILQLAKDVGLSEATYVSTALVFGSRALARHFAPEKYLPPSLVDALTKAGIDLAKEQAAASAGLNEKD